MLGSWKHDRAYKSWMRQSRATDKVMKGGQRTQE
jgi:hypothetical protein